MDDKNAPGHNQVGTTKYDILVKVCKSIRESPFLKRHRVLSYLFVPLIIIVIIIVIFIVIFIKILGEQIFDCVVNQIKDKTTSTEIITVTPTGQGPFVTPSAQLSPSISTTPTEIINKCFLGQITLFPKGCLLGYASECDREIWKSFSELNIDNSRCILVDSLSINENGFEFYIAESDAYKNGISIELDDSVNRISFNFETADKFEKPENSQSGRFSYVTFGFVRPDAKQSGEFLGFNWSWNITEKDQFFQSDQIFPNSYEVKGTIDTNIHRVVVDLSGNEFSIFIDGQEKLRGIIPNKQFAFGFYVPRGNMLHVKVTDFKIITE